MEIWGGVLNFKFHLKLELTTWKEHFKTYQFARFGVVSLDCNPVEGFQKSDKLETLYGFRGRHLGIRDITMKGSYRVQRVRVYTLGGCPPPPPPAYKTLLSTPGPVTSNSLVDM